MRLYIIRGVSEETEFVTQTKKEIGGIEWHKLKDLPTGKADMSQLKEQGKLKYWMVAPFVDRLLPWLAQVHTHAHPSTPKHTKAHSSTPKHTQAHPSTPKHIFKHIPKHTPAPPLHTHTTPLLPLVDRFVP